MSNVIVELNSDGFDELLHSEELRSYLEELAIEISNNCGNGYNYDTYDAGSRIVSSVFTETKEAMKDNLQNNTILYSL